MAALRETFFYVRGTHSQGVVKNLVIVTVVREKGCKGIIPGLPGVSARSFEVFKSVGDKRKRIYIFPRKNSEALSDQLIEYHLIRQKRCA